MKKEATTQRAPMPRMRPGGGPGRGLLTPTEKAKNFSTSAKRLLTQLKAYRIAFGFVLLLAVAGTIFNIVGPKILGGATTTIFVGITQQTGIDFERIGKILTLLLILYASSALATFIQGFTMSTITQRISQSLRTEVTNKIHRMSLKSFDATTHGEILSRVTNDIDTLSQNLQQGAMQILVSAVSMVGVLVMMLSISITMTLVTLVILPASALFIRFVVKKSQKYFVQQQKSLGELNGQVEEVYSAHTVVKAFGAEQSMIDQFEKTNEELKTSAWKSQFLSGFMMPVMQGIGDLGYVAIALLGGALAIRGSISVGDIQAFIQYIRNFTQPIAQVAQVTNMLQSTVAAAERVFEFLDETEEIDEPSQCSIGKLKGEVAFKDVRFGYDEEKPVIHNFSAVAHPGKKIAIVGPTGAGKTTIVKLLMRFYDIQEGEITIDGNSIYHLSRGDLRSHFGMVLQDTWLFSGTIKENIRYGNLSATDQEIEEAATAARIDHFIKSLSEGYETMINEESSNISQGQRQLLTIARAIIANPSMLILDEATSNVDTRTEVLIQQAMDELMRGRTSFIIAHRLSTIKNADLILVMDQGDIIEQGTHQQLLEAQGFYTDLYTSQFEHLEQGSA